MAPSNTNPPFFNSNPLSGNSGSGSSIHSGSGTPSNQIFSSKNDSLAALLRTLSGTSPTSNSDFTTPFYQPTPEQKFIQEVQEQAQEKDQKQKQKQKKKKKQDQKNLNTQLQSQPQNQSQNQSQNQLGSALFPEYTTQSLSLSVDSRATPSKRISSLTIENPPSPFQVTPGNSGGIHGVRFPITNYPSLIKIPSDRLFDGNISESMIEPVSRMRQTFNPQLHNIVAADDLYIGYILTKPGRIRIISQENVANVGLKGHSEYPVISLQFADRFIEDDDDLIDEGYSTSVLISTNSDNEVIVWKIYTPSASKKKSVSSSNQKQSSKLSSSENNNEDDDNDGVILNPEFKILLKIDGDSVCKTSSGRIIGKIYGFSLIAVALNSKIYLFNLDKLIASSDPTIVHKSTNAKNLQDVFLSWSDYVIDTGDTIQDLTFSSDGSVILSVSSNGSINMWSSASFRKSSFSNPLTHSLCTLYTTTGSRNPPSLSSKKIQTGIPSSINFVNQPDSSYPARNFLVGLNNNHTLQLWDFATHSLIQEIQLPDDPEAEKASISGFVAPYDIDSLLPGSSLYAPLAISYDQDVVVVLNRVRNSIFFFHLSFNRTHAAQKIRNTQAQYIESLNDPEILNKPQNYSYDSVNFCSSIEESVHSGAFTYLSEYAYPQDVRVISFFLFDGSYLDISAVPKSTAFALYFVDTNGCRLLNTSLQLIGAGSPSSWSMAPIAKEIEIAPYFVDSFFPKDSTDSPANNNLSGINFNVNEVNTNYSNFPDPASLLGLLQNGNNNIGSESLSSRPSVASKSFLQEQQKQQQNEQKNINVYKPEVPQVQLDLTNLDNSGGYGENSNIDKLSNDFAKLDLRIEKLAKQSETAKKSIDLIDSYIKKALPSSSKLEDNVRNFTAVVSKSDEKLPNLIEKSLSVIFEKSLLPAVEKHIYSSVGSLTSANNKKLLEKVSTIESNINKATISENQKLLDSFKSALKNESSSLKKTLSKEISDIFAKSINDSIKRQDERMDKIDSTLSTILSKLESMSHSQPGSSGPFLPFSIPPPQLQQPQPHANIINDSLLSFLPNQNGGSGPFFQPSSQVPPQGSQTPSQFPSQQAIPPHASLNRNNSNITVGPNGLPSSNQGLPNFELRSGSPIRNPSIQPGYFNSDSNNNSIPNPSVNNTQNSAGGTSILNKLYQDQGSSTHQTKDNHRPDENNSNQQRPTSYLPFNNLNHSNSQETGALNFPNSTQQPQSINGNGSTYTLPLEDKILQVQSFLMERKFEEAIVYWLKAPPSEQESLFVVIGQHDPQKTLDTANQVLILSVVAVLANNLLVAGDMIFVQLHWIIVALRLIEINEPRISDLGPQVLQIVKGKVDQAASVAKLPSNTVDEINRVIGGILWARKPTN